MWARARLPAFPLLLAAALALLWRLPSFFDPPWVNDEGTYFAIAQAIAHGFRLYRDIWENKPPGIYLVYCGVYRAFGPSLLAARLLAALAVVLLVVLAGTLAMQWTQNRRSAYVAAALTGLLFGVPVLEGTTANAEVFLALFAAAGAWFAVVRDWPFAGGIALGMAMLFKAVAGFDAAALALWILLYRRSRLAALLGGIALVLGVTLGLAAWLGILPQMLRDAVLYDVGYVGRGNGGAGTWLVLLKLSVLCGLSVLVRRRPFPVLWLVWAASGALISNRAFGHYALQAVVPLSLCLCLAAPRLTASRRVLLALPAAAVLLAACSAVAGAMLAHAGGDSILSRRLQYYPNFIRYALGTRSYAWYRDQIDDHVTRNLDLARIVRAGPPGRLLVWGNTPWIYPLSGRLPATPYTSALRNPEVPGETAALRAALRAGRPVQVIIINPPMPPVDGAARALDALYSVVAADGNAVVFRRSFTPPR